MARRDVAVAAGLLGAVLAFAASPACAGTPAGNAPLAALRLSLAVLADSGWQVAEVRRAADEATRLLARCGIRTEAIELHELRVEPRYRVLWTPASRELARRVALPRPVVFFVAGTRHRPAFDAEAVGRANATGRPEMADTVWIVAGARDLPNVLAHELVHVLSDSGEHSDEAGNLMRDETSPGNTRLSDAQCGRIVETGVRNGLLRRLAGEGPR